MIASAICFFCAPPKVFVLVKDNAYSQRQPTRFPLSYRYIGLPRSFFALSFARKLSSKIASGIVKGSGHSGHFPRFDRRLESLGVGMVASIGSSTFFGVYEAEEF